MFRIKLPDELDVPASVHCRSDRLLVERTLPTAKDTEHKGKVCLLLLAQKVFDFAGNSDYFRRHPPCNHVDHVLLYSTHVSKRKFFATGNAFAQNFIDP